MNLHLNQKYTRLKCLKTSLFLKTNHYFLLISFNFRLIIVLRNKIHVFSFPNNSKKLFSFDTCDNPKGLCELSSNDDNLILCFPSVKSGFIQIAEINKLNEETISKCPKIFQAHKHDIAAMALDTTAGLIATGRWNHILNSIYLFTCFNY